MVDNSCIYPASEQLLRCQGIWQFIPERCDQRQRRSTHSGRPLAFDGATYGRRNVFERCVKKLSQWRGSSTRYKKRAVDYRTNVNIVALMLCLANPTCHLKLTTSSSKRSDKRILRRQMTKGNPTAQTRASASSQALLPKATLKLNRACKA
jgi:hypothetical protein